MQKRVGSMFDVMTQARLVFMFVTTNAVIKKNGELVMGMGAANHAAKLWPALPAYFGNSIKREEYGIIRPFIDQIHDIHTLAQESVRHSGSIGFPTWWCIGALQTKRHYRQKSTTGMVANSLAKLGEFARIHSAIEVHVNMPGTGLGGLKVDEVQPLIDRLPNNVSVWSYR